MEDTRLKKINSSYFGYFPWLPILSTDGKSLYYKLFRINRVAATLHLEYTGKIPFPKEKINQEDFLFGPLFFLNVMTLTFKDGTGASTLILDYTSNFCYKEFQTEKGCNKCSLLSLFLQN